jgi:hypothetical protein
VVGCGTKCLARSSSISWALNRTSQLLFCAMVVVHILGLPTANSGQWCPRM